MYGRLNLPFLHCLAGTCSGGHSRLWCPRWVQVKSGPCHSGAAGVLSHLVSTTMAGMVQTSSTSAPMSQFLCVEVIRCSPSLAKRELPPVLPDALVNPLLDGSGVLAGQFALGAVADLSQQVAT